MFGRNHDRKVAITPIAIRRLSEETLREGFEGIDSYYTRLYVAEKEFAERSGSDCVDHTESKHMLTGFVDYAYSITKRKSEWGREELAKELCQLWDTYNDGVEARIHQLRGKVTLKWR